MIDFIEVRSLESVYVAIHSSNISANLVKYGTSAITIGQDQDLKLDPSTHSINPDEEKFNETVSTVVFIFIKIFRSCNILELELHLLL